MNKGIITILALIALSSCGGSHTPDVSGIKADVPIARFDKDFFGADSNHMEQGLNEVQKKYPYFFADFIQHIVIGGSTDTVHDLPFIVSSYISNSRPLYDSVQKKFPDLGDTDEQLKKGFNM